MEEEVKLARHEDVTAETAARRVCELAAREPDGPRKIRVLQVAFAAWRAKEMQVPLKKAEMIRFLDKQLPLMEEARHLLAREDRIEHNIFQKRQEIVDALAKYIVSRHMKDWLEPVVVWLDGRVPRLDDFGEPLTAAGIIEYDPVRID